MNPDPGAARPPRSPEVVLVPGVPALLPEHASLTDPVADLRAACVDAVSRLSSRVEVVGDPQGRRVAEHLLAVTPNRLGDSPTYLVVANGTAKRADTSPGYLDERAVPFDDALAAALRVGDVDALCTIDQDLARELWASVTTIPRLADLIAPGSTPAVLYDDAPYGVQYWVLAWS